MIFTPRECQDIIVEHVLKHPRCGIWASMGMGKTSALLFAIAILKLLDTRKVLVLAPLKVAKNTWPSEIAKWDNLKHLKISCITGSPVARIKALQTSADIYATNYENLPWLIETMGERWDFDTVIADESTRLKSYRLRGGGKRARKLAKVAFSKINRFIQLTGTPSPNGLKDLWGQLWFLDKGERLGRTFTSFKNRWFRYPHPNSFEPVPMPHSQKEMENLVKDICISLRAKDYFDIKDPIVVDVPAYLPSGAMKQYKSMEKEMYLALADTEVEAFNAASKTIKCLQIANGAVYTDDKGSWTKIHNAKIDALQSIIEEAAGAPIIVAYHFRSDEERLLAAFPQMRKLGDDPQTITDWNAGKIDLLLAHPASAGHGLNLQDGGNRIVMFGHWWDLEHYLQIIERIGPTRQKQAGYDRPVYIYNIRAVDTVDSLVIENRKEKSKVQDLLLKAARNYNR